MPFAFRLRVRMTNTLDPSAMPRTIEVEGYPPIEVNYDEQAVPCAVDAERLCSMVGSLPGKDRYTFIARGYETKDGAFAAGRSFRDLLLAAGTTRHMGVDVGSEKPSLQFGKIVKDAHMKTTGRELVGDRIGLMAYEQGTVDVVKMEGSISQRTPLDLFLGELQRWRVAAATMSERQRTCAALINDSLYAVQSEAQFVLLVSAVEALCDQSALSDDYKVAVEQLESALSASEASDDVRTTLARVLAQAKRQSLRQAYMGKFRSLLGSDAASEFDRLYQLRSAFVHDGKGRGDLRGEIGTARELAVALFEKDTNANVACLWHQGIWPMSGGRLRRMSGPG